MFIVFVVHFHPYFYISTSVNIVNGPKQIPRPCLCYKTIKTTNIDRTKTLKCISSVLFSLVTKDLKISEVLNKILHFSFLYGTVRKVKVDCCVIMYYTFQTMLELQTLILVYHVASLERIVVRTSCISDHIVELFKCLSPMTEESTIFSRHVPLDRSKMLSRPSPIAVISGTFAVVVIGFGFWVLFCEFILFCMNLLSGDVSHLVLEVKGTDLRISPKLFEKCPFLNEYPSKW